jgi:hypothetical protein
MTGFSLSLIHGVILTAIMIGVFRRRHEMLFSKAILFLVALFVRFLLIDGIVSDPYSADAGLLTGGSVTVLALQYYKYRHRSANRRER